MRCSQCGREIQNDEKYVEAWVHERTMRPTGMPVLGRIFMTQAYCSEHMPGHVKRELLGITEIVGAASLGKRGG